MMCDPQPLSVEQKVIPCAQDTEQKHGKHGNGAPLSSFPLIFAVVLVEHGGRLSSVDRDRELRISGTSAKLVDTSVRLVAG